MIISLFLYLFSSKTSKVEASSNPQNIFGNNRIETSIELSKSVYKTSDIVILAGYYGQVDSLSGTLLAHAKNAPMIYTGKNQKKLDDYILNHIKDLATKEIYILGGESIVSKEIEDALSKDYKVTRVWGQGREETAINIAKEVMGENIYEVFLTARDDNSLADALAVGPVSGSRRIPIFLTKTETLPKNTKDALKEFGVKKVTIIGGDAVISKSIENEIRVMGLTVERVPGKNRIETALNIANRYISNPRGVVIANGWEFADAVVGGYLAARENAPILLTKNKIIDIKNLDYIADNNKQTYILGGKTVIHGAITEDIEFILSRGVVIREEETDFVEPFNIIKQNDPSLSLGKETIKQKGVNGIRRVVDRVYYDKGNQIRRQNISNTLIKRAVDEIVLIGSKR